MKTANDREHVCRLPTLLGLSLLLGASTPAWTRADLATSFQGTTLDPNLFLDVPDSNVGTITLNTEAHKLLFSGPGTDMWWSRNGLPFAWTPVPAVGMGGKWQAETEVQFYDTSPYGRIVGLTTYSGPDGRGGSDDGQEFTFGLDHWDDPNGVWVQGLGDNRPGDSDNLNAELSADSVDLRMVVTVGADNLKTFEFYYKVPSSETWTSLGTIHHTSTDDRVALFFKGSDMNVTFNYFNVTTLAVGVEYGVVTNLDNTLTITGYFGSASKLAIPSQIDDLPVSGIGDAAFYNDNNLTSVTIPSHVASIADYAFMYSDNLTSVYFLGNPPALGNDVFAGDWNVTLYYLPPCTTGWEAVSSATGRQALLWNPVIQAGEFGFGPTPEGFRFTVTGTPDIPIRVDTCTNLSSKIWTPLLTTRLTAGSFNFMDDAYGSYSSRFYRISGP